MPYVTSAHKTAIFGAGAFFGVVVAGAVLILISLEDPEETPKVDRPPSCWVEKVGTVSCDTTKAEIEIHYGMGPADVPMLEDLIRTWAVEDGLDPDAVIAAWGGPVIAPVHSCESELDAQRVDLEGRYVGRITDLEEQATEDTLHLSLTHADLRLYRDAWRRRISYRQLDALVFGPENLRGDW